MVAQNMNKRTQKIESQKIVTPISAGFDPVFISDFMIKLINEKKMQEMRQKILS